MIDEYACFIINWQCSGFVSMIIYNLVAAVLILKLEARRKRKLIYFVIGVLGTYFVNLIRITLIVLYVTYVTMVGQLPSVPLTIDRNGDICLPWSGRSLSSSCLGQFLWSPMTDLSVSLFVIFTLFFVTLGTILAAVGYGYAHGYFKRRRSPRVICGICGNKTSRLRKYCATCGAPAFNFVDLA